MNNELSDRRFDPPDVGDYCCPVCGNECMMLYKTYDGEIVGCDECLHEIYAFEYFEEDENA